MSNDGQPNRLLGYTTLLAALALPATAATLYYFPPSITGPSLLAFATLLALALVGSLLALTISESGAATGMDFVPHLAAIILLGPGGAVVLAIVDMFLTEFVVLRKPRHRAVFNLAQVVLLTAAASVTYVWLGGGVSLDNFDFRPSFPPFLTATVVYFALNSVFVSQALAIIEHRRVDEAWRQAFGATIVLDVVMSSLAYLVAFLYVRWGPVALLSALLPIIGLRYSYGVNLELRQLSQDLLRVLIKTLEARDEYTSGHSVRVAARARKIAVSMGLRVKSVRAIETAALLHDIGKIDLAYSEILRQTGPLTPEQRELIRAHPDKGVDIVSSVRSIDNDILRSIRHHHEQFDGSGYPVGLAGENIPLGARIIGLSDAIDAMMTDRPYRAALSIEQVRQEVLRNSGSQFDPMVVEAALAAGVLDHDTIDDEDAS